MQNTNTNSNSKSKTKSKTNTYMYDVEDYLSDDIIDMQCVVETQTSNNTLTVKSSESNDFNDINKISDVEYSLDIKDPSKILDVEDPSKILNDVNDVNDVNVSTELVHTYTSFTDLNRSLHKMKRIKKR